MLRSGDLKNFEFVVSQTIGFLLREPHLLNLGWWCDVSTIRGGKHLKLAYVKMFGNIRWFDVWCETMQVKYSEDSLPSSNFWTWIPCQGCGRGYLLPILPTTYMTLCHYTVYTAVLPPILLYCPHGCSTYIIMLPAVYSYISCTTILPKLRNYVLQNYLYYKNTKTTILPRRQDYQTLP